MRIGKLPKLYSFKLRVLAKKNFLCYDPYNEQRSCRIENGNLN